ncbi:MAG: hypothetical protein WAM28_03690 [Chlamydiales bacterium]
MSLIPSSVSLKKPDNLQVPVNEQREEPLEGRIETIGRKAIEIQDGLLLWAGLEDARLKEREIKPITETTLKELIEESAKHHRSFNKNTELDLFPDGLTLILLDKKFRQILRDYHFEDIIQWYNEDMCYFDFHIAIKLKEIERVAMLQFIFNKFDKLSTYRGSFLLEMLRTPLGSGNPMFNIHLIYIQTQLSSKLLSKYKWIKSFSDNPIKIANEVVKNEKKSFEFIDHIILQYLGGINLITEEFNEILNPDVERCHLRDYVHHLLYEMMHNQVSCEGTLLTQDDLQRLGKEGYITLAAERYRETGRGWVVKITETGDPLVRVAEHTLLPLKEITSEDRAYLEEEEEEVRQARERGEEKELNIWIGYRMRGITDKTARLILDQVCI